MAQQVEGAGARRIPLVFVSKENPITGARPFAAVARARAIRPNRKDSFIILLEIRRNYDRLRLYRLLPGGTSTGTVTDSGIHSGNGSVCKSGSAPLITDVLDVLPGSVGPHELLRLVQLGPTPLQDRMAISESNGLFGLWPVEVDARPLAFGHGVVLARGFVVALAGRVFLCFLARLEFLG